MNSMTIILILVGSVVIGLLLKAGSADQPKPDLLIGDPVPPEILAMSRSGKKAEAAKAYRVRTGCSLEVALKRIEGLPAA